MKTFEEKTQAIRNILKELRNTAVAYRLESDFDTVIELAKDALRSEKESAYANVRL